MNGNKDEWRMADPSVQTATENDERLSPSTRRRKVSEAKPKETPAKPAAAEKRFVISIGSEEAARFEAARIRYITEAGRIISKVEFVSVLLDSFGV